jgi:hypothetical protein
MNKTSIGVLGQTKLVKQGLCVLNSCQTRTYYLAGKLAGLNYGLSNLRYNSTGTGEEKSIECSLTMSIFVNRISRSLLGFNTCGMEQSTLFGAVKSYLLERCKMSVVYN